MKKTLLALVLGCASVSTLMAANVDVFITGSTAFRANVYEACKKLYVGGTPNIYYGDASHGGANSGFSGSTAAWAMTGTPITGLTNLNGNTLIIHGLFTGSIQGIETVVQNTTLTFPNADGVSPGGLCQTYVNAAPTIGFSDSSSTVCPFPAVAPYVEEPVCVQPFVMCKSVAAGAVTNINNISWEQLEYGIPQGRIPASAWTGKAADTNNFVYLLQRTKDSGTRRCETAQQYFSYNDPVGIYIYDGTTNGFYVPTVLTNNVGTGLAPAGVVGAAGLNNANLNWGYGYVGGGDIRTTLAINNAANQSIAMLSFGDAKSLGSSNWAQVVSFNGVWPTTDGAGLRGNLVIGGNGSHTNDFSPITTGYYPCWGAEVLIHPSGTGANPQTGNNITLDNLGDYTKPGTFMGVFNAQTLVFTNLAAPLTGSIENEIELSKTNLATAIRLSDMYQSRAQVGGTITPRFK